MEAADLFLGSNSNSLPNITSPTLKNLTNSFKDMSNLTTFPQLNLPVIYNMDHAFEDCINLTGEVPYTGFKIGVVWIWTFSNCPKITYVPMGFFKTGSNYEKTFLNCTGLLSISGQVKDTFVFPGWSYLNTFRECTNFVLPLTNTTGTAVRFTFPDAVTIAGCFYNSNALGSSTVTRQSLQITANDAGYADIFLDTQKPSADTRKFGSIYITLPRLKGAQFFLCPITLTENLQLTALTPDNGDNVNHNMLPYLSMSGGTVNVTVSRDTSISDMYNQLSIPIMDTLKYYMWNEISIENINVTMEVINDLQRITVIKTIMFMGCTFINPTGLGTLQDPGSIFTFYCSGCTGVNVLSNCLSGNHRIAQ